MMYSGGVVVSVESGGDSDGSSEVGGGDCCSESTDSVSNSLSNSYSELDVFLCKD